MSDEHVFKQAQIIAEITKKIHTQKTLGEETYAIADSTAKALDAYREAQQTHEEKLGEFMKEMILLKDTVNLKLLPVYDKEQREIIANEVIKERAKDFKFWASVIASLVGFLVTVGWVIKQLK